MAVLLPTFQVKITNADDNKVYLVKAISQITVNLSSEKPCDTAEVNIPTIKKPMIKKKNERGGEDEIELITPNDMIEIAFGYIGEKADLVTVFSGLVSWVSPDVPLVIKAEDHFRKAKHSYVNDKYGTDANPMWYSKIADEVLKIAGLTAYIPTREKEGDWQTTGLDLKKQTVAQAMEKLSQDTEWIHFFIPGSKNEVYFGPPFPYQREFLPKDGVRPPVFLYRIGTGRVSAAAGGSTNEQSSAWGNIISASSLNYQSEKPYRRVVCNLVDKRFTSKSVEKEAVLTDAECGEQDISFTAHYEFKSSKAENEKEAERRAEERLNQLNSGQYTGSFTTFGNPRLKHSQIFKLESTERPEINALYEAKAVTFNYSPTGGFRMTVEVSKPPDKSNTKQGG